MPMDDVGEFKVDMPMAFRTHMGVLVGSECSVKEKNIGASYCTISEPSGRRPH